MATSAKIGIERQDGLAAALDARVVGSSNNERAILIALFIMIYVAYGALGRDVFVNHGEVANAGTTDPIGRVLPFVRFGLCIGAAFLVVTSAGLTWALSKVPLLFAPFCLLALASSTWSADPKTTFQNAAVLTALWIGLSMVVHRLGLIQAARSSLHLIAAVLIISAALAILVPSVGTHTGLELSGGVSHIGRWRGIFAHKNGLGPWAAYGSVFLFTHSWMCGGPRLYWWLARICALACLFFSGSATSLILAIVLLILWGGFVMLRRVKLAVVFTTSLAAMMLAGAILFIFQGAIFELLGRDATFTGRTGIWELALEYAKEHPWFGVGFFTLGGPEFLERILVLFEQGIPGPENGYFVVLLELGIVGLLCFFVPFFTVIRNGLEWMKHVELQDRAAIEFQLMILISTLVFSITESNALICTGFDGPIAFGGFLALLTTPRSPDSRLRGEFRLAKYYLPERLIPGTGRSSVGHQAKPLSSS